MRIFSTLRPRDLRKLAAACLLRRYGAGDSILEEGSTGLGMFLITTGRVEVFKTYDGRKIPLAVLSGGDVLGEMALLDDQPRSASARALADTECLLLSRGRFRTLLRRRPRIAWPIVPSLVRRVRDLQEQLLAAANRAAAAADRARDADAADGVPEPPPAAPSPEIVEPAAVAAAGDGDSEVDVLRAPYALMMTGAVGFGESARLVEIFFRALDESSGLTDGRPMGEVVRQLPESLLTAGASSWEHGRRLPSKLLETFRDRLQSSWREEDPA